MTTSYQAILDSEIDADSPITTSLMFRLRDNLIAYQNAEYDDGSPPPVFARAAIEQAGHAVHLSGSSPGYSSDSVVKLPTLDYDPQNLYDESIGVVGPVPANGLYLVGLLASVGNSISGVSSSVLLQSESGGSWGTICILNIGGEDYINTCQSFYLEEGARLRLVIEPSSGTATLNADNFSVAYLG